MKILIVNDKIIEGGAEQSCLKMKKLLEENKQEVYYLTFDNEFERKIKTINNNKNIINIKTTNNVLNKIIFNIKLYFQIRNKLKKIKPEKVILNNIFISPITQLKALKGYEVYQIVRDYSIVCPKLTATKCNHTICKGYKYNNCIKECEYHNSKIQLIVKLKLIKKMEKLRKKYVKKFISPSQKLNEYLTDYGYKSCYINNPMDIKVKNEVKEKIGQTKKYIYIGMVNENKGIYKILDVYKEFSKNRDVILKIVGKCTTNEDSKKIDRYVRENPKVIYEGYKEHNEVIEELKKSDILIVPSLWMENYPTTALEGMLCKCLVIGSNRGGIPEIIGEDRGYLFEILDTKNIEETLKKTYEIEEEEYDKIIQTAYNYIINNNSYDKYYKELEETLKD